MTHQTINIFRKIAHWILVALSMGLSINLFIQFSDNPWIQPLFGLMGLSTEIIKLYVLIEAKSDFLSRIRVRLISATAKFSVYLALAAVSAVASLGFTLLSLEQQSFAQATDVDNIERRSIRSEIEEVEEQIRTNMNRYEELPSDWVTVSQQYMDRVEDLRERRDTLIQRLREFETEESGGATEDMFVLLGEMVGLDGRSTMFNMMLFLVVLLELTIALTAGNVDRKKKEEPESVPQGEEPRQSESTEDPQVNTEAQIENLVHQAIPSEDALERFISYIDCLFDEGDGARLASDRKVSEKSGISLEECSTFRQILQTTTYKGRPMISSMPGMTRPGFKKSAMKKVMWFKINTGVVTINS